MLWTFLIVAAVILVLAAPLFVVARRNQRPTTIRNFLIGAGVIAFLFATLAWTSETQVGQCRAEGNSDCIDAGAAGLQFLMVGGYVVTSWVVAYLIHGDS